MSKISETKTATIARDNGVVKSINSAVRAGNTMLAATREAAKLASAQLDNALPVKERLAQVISAYSQDLAQNHNVKALFVDALTLLALADTPVAVKVVGKDRKAVDTYTTASEAVDMSKHNMRDAAKQAREAHGLGRKTTPKAPKAATPKSAPSAPDMLSIDAFQNWLDIMPEYLNDSVFHGRIVAALITEGYSLSKATKGRAIKGAASA